MFVVEIECSWLMCPSCFCCQHSSNLNLYNNFQMARKIALNSAYGALGNQYFRYYKLENAEAITLSGQVSIRWIEARINL